MAARKSMPKEAIEMKDRFETFVVQGTNESFATTDNHMLFMSPIVNPPIVNSMDANWPSVDYSVLRGNTATTVQLIDPTGSLNYIQQQQQQQQSQQPMQTLTNNTHPSHLIGHSNNAQTHTVQQQQQPHQQQTHAGVVEVSNAHGQQAVGHLLQAAVQSTSSAHNSIINIQPQLLLTNQQIPANMWQSNAPPPAPPQPPPSFIVSHVHPQHTQQHQQQPHPATTLPQQQQQQTTYVNVGVQAGGMDADGNPTLDPLPNPQQSTHPRTHSKLPAKKRLSNIAQSGGSTTSHFPVNVPPKKRSKISGDKKAGKPNKITGADAKEIKRKRAAIRKKKRNSNPNNWKKNIRKLNRVQGQPYVNSRGKLVPARTRSGPPCSCRMRCFDKILENECNEIFQRFLQIADKDIQDALLYSLITKEEVKHRKWHKVLRDGTEQPDPMEPGESPESRHNVRNATFLYHVQCQEGIVRVCSSAFSSIYGATQKRIRRLQQHKFIDPLNPPTDLRGKHGHQKEASGRKVESSSSKALNMIQVVPPQRKEDSEHKRMKTNLVNEGIAFCVSKLSQHQQRVNQHIMSVNTQTNNKTVDYSVISNQQGLLTFQQQQQQQGSHLGDQTLTDSGGIEASNFLGGFLLGASGGPGEMKLLQNYDHTGVEHSVKNLSGTSLQDTVQQAVGDLSDGTEKSKDGSNNIKDDSKQAGRSRHPELWKKNIRKKNRAHGMAYINTKGELVPAKSRTGPPCHCRMRCYLRINEEQCNKIFGDFHNIGDKNVQDGLLYNLMIHKEVKKKKLMSLQRGRILLEGGGGLTEEGLHSTEGIESGTTEGREIKAKPVYQGDLLDLIFNDNDKDSDHVRASEMEDKFVQNLVSGGMGDLSDSQREDDGGFTGIINLSTRHLSTSGISSSADAINFSTTQSGLCSTLHQDTEEGEEEEEVVLSLDNTKKHSSQKSRDRQSTFWYYVQLNSGLVRVCSTAFMSIYGATQKRVRRLQQHKVVNPITPPKDMRGKHGHTTMVQTNSSKGDSSSVVRATKRSKGSNKTGKKQKTGNNNNNTSRIKDMVDTNLGNDIQRHQHSLDPHQQPQQQVQHLQHHPAQHTEVLHNGIIMVTSEPVRTHNNPPTANTQAQGVFLPSQGVGIQAMNLAGQNHIWQNTAPLPITSRSYHTSDIPL